MEFEDEAFVLAARPYGEAGVIVEALTREHGKWAAHVAGGASRRMAGVLQPGARAVFRYRSRISEQLGSATLEGVGEGAAVLFDDAAALAAMASAAALLAQALPEREPHGGAFLAFEALMSALEIPEIWPAVMVRFEAGLLETLGFGLDLSRCAVSGSTDNLAFVSPRTGRAVGAEAGEAWRERLLRLPPFMISAQQGLGSGDIGDGLAITGWFLQKHVFDLVDRPLPPARERFVARLAEEGRL
ncbi:MAG TPA: DNA repair protein RecO [Caulobacteraceae bacterium]|jgi:DNA repair protein RecO (recombination protein O)|nr:DNA repair protein RecO [Caulobacteraceae bacterium]